MDITQRKDFGFTIVELLVVIVIIGILAAITIVSYTGITQKAVTASLTTDLDSASKQLKLYQVANGSFPTALNASNCPTAPVADNTLCLKPSNGNTFSYSSDGITFGLKETNTNGVSYGVNNTTSPIALAQPTDCPSGFIPVPGSATYGQAGFCVMKYAASQVGASNVPQSIPSVLPWVNIDQTTAIANSQNVAGCTGCHLITEAEWMTIAQNVLSVASNWSGGSVGNGVISSGHNDSAPNNALVPDPSDANSNAGETNQTFAQKRTLTLTNGQVIWDLAGNVREWTAGQTNGTTAQQPGVSGNGFKWREWTSITANGTLPVNPSSSGTGLSGANIWNSNNGVGQIDSNSDDTGLYGFVRGGNWNFNVFGGVLGLYLTNAPSNTFSALGFRVSR